MNCEGRRLSIDESGAIPNCLASLRIKDHPRNEVGGPSFESFGDSNEIGKNWLDNVGSGATRSHWYMPEGHAPLGNESIIWVKDPLRSQFGQLRAAGFAIRAAGREEAIQVKVGR